MVVTFNATPLKKNDTIEYMALQKKFMINLGICKTILRGNVLECTLNDPEMVENMYNFFENMKTKILPDLLMLERSVIQYIFKPCDKEKSATYEFNISNADKLAIEDEHIDEYDVLLILLSVVCDENSIYLNWKAVLN